ncbi:MAG: hydrogen peroxide-inducible genes activator [Rhizobiaceae bacterium]|nr:MAG: hydrogen peroxide-inducible genes activator [Rhizobiaceae bacterium]CAG1013653.1 Hydrogen peroxide-inducible genes activator [Rhizobiaceae bacterium]
MPFRPSLRQLEYVVAVHDLKHFGRAARYCNVSQPTLSVQVSLVEQGLGTLLFERTSSHVAATPAGDRLARGARLLLASLDDLLGDIRAQGAALGGTIRLGTPPTFGPYFLPKLLPTLHEQYPDLQIYVREDNPAALEASVAAGSIDCGLGPSPELDGLAFWRIGRETLYLGVPAEHPLAAKSTVSLAALHGEKLLALGRGHRLLENVRHLADVSGARIINDFEGTSLDAIRQMVSIGMGLSLFPQLYAKAEFRDDDDVKLLEFEDWNEQRDVGLYWREGSGREHHYRAVAETADLQAARLELR